MNEGIYWKDAAVNKVTARKEDPHGWIYKEAEKRGFTIDPYTLEVMKILVDYEGDLTDGYDFYCEDPFEVLLEITAGIAVNLRAVSIKEQK